MDEPLASLDDARRVEILPVIERLRDFAGIPIVYVSHSVAEVARLATTVVVMSEGGVAAVGPAGEIMQRLDLFPLTGRAEAGSVIEAIVEGHDAALGLSLLRSKAGLWRLPRIDLATGSRLRLRVRARDVMLATKRPEGISALNIFSATVTELVPREGGVVDLRLDSSGESLLARVTRHSVGELGLGPGSGVFALVKSVAFDRHSLSGPLRSAELDLGASDA
jgi:molybdate transport system ATP-binding protein